MSTFTATAKHIANLLFANEAIASDAVLLPDANVYAVGQQITARIGFYDVTATIVEVDYSDPAATWLYVEYECAAFHGGVALDRTWITVTEIVKPQTKAAAVTVSKSSKALQNKIEEAYRFGNNWLYKANIARERGDTKSEEKHLKKAQYWLDRLNELEGYNDGSLA